MDSKEISSTDTSENGPCIEEELECAVCLQTCVHPVRLPCSHIFCFLCVKGVANQSKRCAMCRQEIPADFLDNPNLLKKIEEKETDSEGYQWFYEGRNGWWQYDERTSLDLENAYSGGQRLFEVLVAGFLYTVDFDRMVQQRRNDPSRRRRIKRDLGTIPKKGVAGLKTDLGDALTQVEEEGSDSPPSAPQLPEQVQHPSSSESSLPMVTPAEGDSSPSRPPLPPSPSRVISAPRSASSSELAHLHLLHSDFHRSICSDFRAFPVVGRRTAPVTMPTSPPRTADSSDRVTAPRYSPSSTPYTRLQHFFNGLNSSPSNNSEESGVPSDVGASLANPESDDSVNTITDHIRSLVLDTDESEYYSLDGTEEYSLPNDSEKL